MKSNPTRIRYMKGHEPNELRSMRRFEGNQGAIYEVVLNLKEMSYKIRNLRQRTIVRSTEKDSKKPPQHLNTLKRQAKNALMSMGVTFDIDLRGIDV